MITTAIRPQQSRGRVEVIALMAASRISFQAKSFAWFSAIWENLCIIVHKTMLTSGLVAREWGGGETLQRSPVCLASPALQTGVFP